MKTCNTGTLTLTMTLTASSPSTPIRWRKVISPWLRTLAATNYFPTSTNRPSSIWWTSMVVQVLINKRVLSDKSLILYRKIRLNTPRTIIKIQICSLLIRSSKVACRSSSRLTAMDWWTTTCIPTTSTSLTLFRVSSMVMPSTTYPFYRNNNNSNNSNNNSSTRISFSHQYNSECIPDTTSINN